MTLAELIDLDPISTTNIELIKRDIGIYKVLAEYVEAGIL